MRYRTARLVFGAVAFAVFVFCGVSPVYADTPAVPHPNVPPTECEAHVGYDRDVDLPGYLIAKGNGPTQCVPITVTAIKPPKGYQGDFYVDEFTNAKLRARWVTCKADPVCYKRVNALVTKRMPPNKEYFYTDPHARFLLGKIDPKYGAALTKIRRPAFFARAPYHEDVANADAHTFSVSFTAPRGPYEKLVMNLHSPIHLRGWYMQGRGIDDGKGSKVRALVIMSNGGGGRVVAIEAPSDRLYHMDPETHKSVLNKYPNATTGAPGQRVWRELLYHFYQAGFDVLSYDRRGVGVSDGYTDTNTLQQGRDILQAIQSLKTGRGLAVLSPSGKRFTGKAAAKALMGGANAETLPVILGGNSRGTMSSGWAMMQNFDKTCSYDMPVVKCGPPKKITNIKGAMMISGFTAGAGYGVTRTSQKDRDRALFT
ncbi:MAG TPA: hypothetical protein VFI93_01810, partial [Rhizomicrobium sp.]|nr:hypothetical protein [Rhizomicrobium sp.]